MDPDRSRIAFLDLRATYVELRDEFDDAYRRVMDSGWYVLGDEVKGFEASFARASGAEACVGVGTGLDALTLGLRALDVGPGDDVLVPANTYIATWLAVSRVGARVVAVDPDPETANVDGPGLERAITAETKAILPVHLYGAPAPMGEILDLGRQHDVAVLADAAQAHGALLDGAPLGACGDLVAWSFYPGKNLGAFGDGGALTTNRPDLDQRIRSLRNYGSSAKYVNDERGYNSRLDELQAAFLSVKLQHLAEWQSRRQVLAHRYLEGLAGTPLVLPTVPAGDAVHGWHLFVVRSPRRDELAAALRDVGIETLIHYPIPPYRQRAYAGDTRSWTPAGELAVSDAIHAEALSLPIGPHLSLTDQDRVIERVVDVTARW